MARFELELTIRGPVVTAGLGSAGHGVDTPFLRDGENGIILPGTQLRGILRQILEMMSSDAPDHLPPGRIACWFGASTGNTQPESLPPPPAWAPRSTLLEFDNLRPANFTDRRGALTRIAVDAATGSVVAGALQVVEAPVGIGEDVVFRGAMSMALADPEAAEAASWIGKALQLMPAIGAHKSAGFGRVVMTRITPAADVAAPARSQDATTIAACAAAGAAHVTLTFAEPFLVAAQAWGGNVFRGSDIVPGGVWKGAIAAMLGAEAAAHPLHDALATAVFRHLKPALPDAPRPRAIPLSLFHVDGIDDELNDALKVDPESLGDLGIVSFAPDWKASGPARAVARKLYDHSFEPIYDIRTHTQVGAKSGSAETGMLYSYAAVKPSGHVWKGSIGQGDLNADAFRALLAGLPARVTGLGKTRVAADLAMAAPTPTGAGVQPSQRIRLVLETDAVLHAPADVHSHADAPDPGERLRLQYLDYFADALGVAPGDLAEFRFYASQRLAGGYQAIRYPPTEHRYHPWFVTLAGSVFDFVLPGGAGKTLEQLLSHGLPPPVGLPAHAKIWSGNPFVPENGYGEVRLERAGGAP